MSDISHRHFFADTSPKAWVIKENINKWDCIKLKVFCTAKETSKKKTPSIFIRV